MKRFLSFFSVLLLAVATSASAGPVQYVIEISVDGLGGTYLGKLFDGTATGGPYSIPNFNRLKNEGAYTLAAHNDNDNWETLPNHVSILTGRPRDSSPGFDGHNWTSNGDPAVGQTIQSNKGSYVASVFDVAHDNGLRTGMYANKSKFSLFDTYGTYTGGGSYNATNGAPDITGPDNGRDKIDNPYINTTLGGIVVDTYIAQQKTTSPNQFAFLHINEPDANGHGSGWGSATWNSSVVTVDGMLGKIFQMIQDVPAMKDHTAIILTADHGNQDNPPTGADRYQVPLFVWGPVGMVKAGAELYSLNASNRQVAPSYPMTTYAGMQPIRNAEASNLALELLGLSAIPGSSFDFTQDLNVNKAKISLSTPVNATIITGGTTSLGATIQNSAGVASSNLNYTLAAAVLSGSASLGTVASSSGTLVVGGSAAATVSATSTNVGPNTITFTATDAAAGNSPQTINAALTVLDHSSAKFVANGGNTLNLDFGTVSMGHSSQHFQILNLAGDYRAGLDFDSITELSDPNAVFSTNAALFSNLAAGGSSSFFDIFLDPVVPGNFSGQYRFMLSDQDGLSGSLGGQTLTLNVSANVAVPEPSTLVLAAAGLAALCGIAWRKRRAG